MIWEGTPDGVQDTAWELMYTTNTVLTSLKRKKTSDTLHKPTDQDWLGTTATISVTISGQKGQRLLIFLHF